MVPVKRYLSIVRTAISPVLRLVDTVAVRKPEGASFFSEASLVSNSEHLDVGSCRWMLRSLNVSVNYWLVSEPAVLRKSV